MLLVLEKKLLKGCPNKVSAETSTTQAKAKINPYSTSVCPLVVPDFHKRA